MVITRGPAGARSASRPSGHAARYVARAEWRARRGSSLLLAVLAGVVGALGVAGFAAARRGPDAFERLITAFHPADGSVLIQVGTPVDAIEALFASTAEDPDVAGYFAGELSYQATPDHEIVAGLLRAAEGGRVERPSVLRGRLPAPDAPYELAVNEVLARHRGLDVGDHLDIGVYGAAQSDDLANGADLTPAHGVHRFTVVGVTVAPTDLGLAADDAEHEFASWSPALWWELDGDLAGYGAGVIVDVAAGADPAAVLDRLAAPLGADVFTIEGSDHAADFAQTAQTIGQQANALRAVALVLSVSGAVLIAQALRRQVASGVLAHTSLDALGLARHDHRAAALWWLAPVVAVAVVVTVGGAIALSPLGPIGVARAAELDRGIRVDAPLLALGTLVLVSLLVVVGTVPMHAPPDPASAARHRTSRLAHLVPGPTATVAASLAGGHMRPSSRTRTSLAALALALGAVTTAAAFGASLDRATTDPASYGWTWDVTVAECGEMECARESTALLAANEDVASFTGLTATNHAAIPGIDHPIEASIVDIERGWAAGRITSGRPPASADEVVIGEGTAHEAGVAVGDTVRVGVEGGDPAPFTVVGLFDPPAPLLEDAGTDDGIAATREGAKRSLPPEMRSVLDEAVPPQWFLVDLDDGVDEQAAMARLEQDFPGTVRHAFRTDRLEGAYRLRALPALLAAVVAALGAGGLVHLAAISALRRRSTLAVMRALGFDRGQIRRTVTYELLFVTGAQAVVGIVLGVAAGRMAWRAAAGGLGSASDPVLPLGRIGELALAVLLVAAVVGSVGGVLAARQRTPSPQRA